MPERLIRRWGADELAQLRRLVGDGLPLSSIATSLGRTVQAIRTKAAHERLCLLDDVARRSPAPQGLAMSDRPGSDPPSPAQPAPRDYVVLYQRHRPAGSPRVALIRLLDGGTHHLIRTTFESAEDSGPRFEDQARRMAAAAGTSGFRCVDGVYTPLDTAGDDRDGYANGIRQAGLQDRTPAAGESHLLGAIDRQDRCPPALG